MSILGILAGGAASVAGSAAGGVVDAFGSALDKLFTSDDERLSRAEALERLAQQPHLAQVELNKIEAGSRSLFVAGWRPFIGWVGGAALAWVFILYDFLLWLCALKGWPVPPKLVGTENLLELVLAMLGLGGMRTFEKTKGVTK